MPEKIKYTDVHDLPLCLKVPDVASIMGIGIITAYQLVKSEGFPNVNIGKRIIIPRDRFLEWLDNQTEQQISVFQKKCS